MHAGSDRKVAGVAVLLKAGSANATIQQIWEHMPKSESKEQEIAGVEINPANLLPRDSAYYTYVGSLRAPPCTEDVTWFVLRTPLAISKEQIQAFAQLYPHDVRPLQPLNGRVVKESQSESPHQPHITKSCAQDSSGDAWFQRGPLRIAAVLLAR